MIRPDIDPTSAVRSTERLDVTRTAYAQKNEARLFALAVVRDPEYRASVMIRAKAGRLAPAVECLIMAYAWGKPADRIELGRPGDFEDLESLTPAELRDRARFVASVLDQEVSSEDLLMAQKAAEEETDAALELARLKHVTKEARSAREAFTVLSNGGGAA